MYSYLATALYKFCVVASTIKIAFKRSRRSEVFCKKRCLKNFAKFTGKQLGQSLVSNKAAGLWAATLSKKRLDSGTDVFL